RCATLGVECRIACGDALHRIGRLAMAVGAGAPCCPRLRAPGHLPIKHPQHSWIGRIFVLHRLSVCAHLLVGRAALIEWNVAGENGKCGAEECDDDDCRSQCERAALPGGKARPTERPSAHSTMILACSVAEKPLSPVHWNSNVPLSVATVEKVMNGLAAMAG